MLFCFVFLPIKQATESKSKEAREIKTQSLTLTLTLKLKRTYGTRPACSWRRRNSAFSLSSWICFRSSSSFLCSASCFCSAFHTFSMFLKLPVCHPFLFKNFSAIFLLLLLQRKVFRQSDSETNFSLSRSLARFQICVHSLSFRLYY